MRNHCLDFGWNFAGSLVAMVVELRSFAFVGSVVYGRSVNSLRLRIEL
jgi:hypothetical protein